MKICRTCGATKPLEEFAKKANAADGRQSACKPCSIASAKKWQKDNPEKVREYERRVYREQPARSMWEAAKARAKREGIAFEITKADVEAVTAINRCAIFGMELKTGGPKQDNSASLDRIDPTLGYVPGNIQLLSLLANRMKNSATPAQLETFAAAVLPAPVASWALPIG